MTHPPPPAFDEAGLAELQSLLDGVPPPLDPLDLSALDGYLCGVLLQPRPVAFADWVVGVTDVDGRALPPSFDAARLHELLRARHAELDRAIARRDWFDPWIFQLDDGHEVRDAVLPWVAGFASALERFPALMALDDPALVEPMALVYLHFDPEDLEDADALLEAIEAIEPPADLADAVQDLVRAVMLIADVSRPRAAPRTPPGTPRRRAAGRR